MTDLREQIANLVPLSLLDGRDTRNNVFEVADDIIALLRAEGVKLPNRTERVRYNHGGSAEWIAEEYSPGWWTLQGWGNTTMPTEDFEKNFTKVEDL